MNIAMFSDKEGSAIWRLGEMIKRRLPQHKITHLTMHPKRPSPEEIEQAHQAIKEADIIDFQYWKSGVLLRRMFPELAGKKMILNHHNEHNINDDAKNHWLWQELGWSKVVCKNGWQQQQLNKNNWKAHMIKHAIEFDNFKFQPKLTEEKIVGYVGQIKKVKGVKQLKQACDELGYKLMIIGKPSEAEYWAEFPKENLIWYQDVPDDKIGELYHQMRVMVCNSDDGTESGTMPILEAMASGIPVITRNIGLVRDCGENMKNMYIRDGKYTDIEDLKNALIMMMESTDVCDVVRENAWRTVRQYHPDIQAREYEKVYQSVMYPDQKLVSIIMPTHNRSDLLTAQFEGLQEQNYKNFELIICDDGSTDNTKAIIEEARKLYDYPIKYIQTGNFPIDGKKKYGIAQARNMGVIEAIGDILIFCDDRLLMNYDAIQAFVDKLAQEKDLKAWVWGSKGVFKQFVENFSAIPRRTFINAGMFNERIDEYGGMTQELSNRFSRQEIRFEWTPEALCTPIMTTHSRSKNRESIIRSKIKLYKLGFL